MNGLYFLLKAVCYYLKMAELSIVHIAHKTKKSASLQKEDLNT